LPVIADVSPEHRFALISVPGIGGTFITRRVRDVVMLVIAELTGNPERPKSSINRDRARLYNVSTLITLLIGVSVQYVALFFLLLIVSLTPGLLAREIGHPASSASYFLVGMVAGVDSHRRWRAGLGTRRRRRCSSGGLRSPATSALRRRALSVVF
jgi:hypothetical protein